MGNLSQQTIQDLSWFIDRAQAPRLRSMRQFAEAEIVIPDGPFAGRRFRCSRQPYTGLWFDEVDSGRWSRCVATGPTQSGKTLCCFVIPLLYHLFEVGETVICGLPDMDMAADKWRESILPVIEQSRYRDLLPQHGGGSRGGKVESILFLNGSTLKFMSGGGGDKSRAGFTSRVVVVTETDGLDKPGRTSRESDKLKQLEARTRAYGSRKRLYLECTVSTEEGRTWQEYQQGTQSQIVLLCPHCQGWVSPEREQLTGWQEADSQESARLAGKFACPACHTQWTEQDRAAANGAARLLHRGQETGQDGAVTGEPPATDTFGFRWSAVHNLFLTAGDLAADEWRAARSTDEENAEREMRQFVWCLPSVPAKWDQTSLETSELLGRMAPFARGMVPPGCKHLTAAVDIGKYLLHWIVVAWSEGATGHVVDYSRIEVASDDLGQERAVLVALKQFREQVQAGWPVAESQGEVKIPDVTWIDAGYLSPVVYTFCRETGRKFLPSIGRGAGQQRSQWYNRPTSTGAVVKQLGEGFHINLLPAEKLYLVEVDSDYWKTWVHQRLSTPLGNPGAMTFFQALPQEHLALVKHLTAETKKEEFIAGKGLVVKWERLRRQNHWLDALYNACAAGYLSGVRLVEEPKLAPQSRRPLVVSGGIRRPDGSPWIDLSRWHGVAGRSPW